MLETLSLRSGLQGGRPEPWQRCASIAARLSMQLGQPQRRWQHSYSEPLGIPQARLYLSSVAPTDLPR
jgi:hypothetical protein